MLRTLLSVVFTLIILHTIHVPTAAQLPNVEPPPEVLNFWRFKPPADFVYRDVAVDRWGVVYVTESENNRVLKYDSDGTDIGEWGEPGGPWSGFYEPRGIAVDPTGYYVYVVEEHRVSMFTEAGDYLTEWGVIYTSMYFRDAHDVIVDADGFVYVTDRGHGIVAKFAADGAYLGHWGENLRAPHGITVDDLGRLWIADPFENRLVIYTSDLVFVDEWAGAWPELPINDPVDCVVDPRGNVYVLDVPSTVGEGYLRKFDRYGTFLSEVSSPLVGSGGVTLFGNGLLYVADTFQNQMVVLGYPPTLTLITDIPDDQGGWVRLRWEASVLDDPLTVGLMTGYTVYRRNDGGTSSRPPHPKGPDAHKQETAKGLEGWDVLATIPARGNSAYYYVAQTLCDSTSQGVCSTTYLVTAFTEHGEFHDSQTLSGYSTDDIPPPVPGGLLVTEIPGQLELRLDWGASSALDLAYYGVYRGTTPGFTVVDPYAPFGVADAPSFVDDSVAPGETWCYRVAAFDDADGFSGVSADQGVTVVSAVEEPPGDTFGLEQNIPNPFNPATTISFRLPRDSRVTIQVFDASGRLVRTLIDGAGLEAGPQTARWDGRGQSGRSVAAGIYFYRLEAGNHRETKRMVLVK